MASLLAIAGPLFADCSQPPTVDISVTPPNDDGDSLVSIPYSFPDTTSPSQRRLSFAVQRVGGSIWSSDPVPASEASGVWSFYWNFSCSTPGTYILSAGAHSCGGEIYDSATVTFEAQPTVDVTYSGPDAQGHGQVIVNYNFPKTYAPEQRLLTHVRRQGNVISTGPTLRPAQRTGTWVFDYNMTCLTGTFSHIVQASHCNGLVATDQDDVTVSTASTAQVSVGEPDDYGNLVLTLNYSFPNTDSPSQRNVGITVVYPGGVISAPDFPVHPAQQTGTHTRTINVACLPPNTLTIIGSAESCGGRDDDSVPYTPHQPPPTVEIGPDTANPRDLVVDYTFPSTASNNQRVLQLVWAEDDTVIESKLAPDPRGKTRFTFPACTPDHVTVKVVAVSCGNQRAVSNSIPIPNCEASCSVACPDCVGAPIRITSGNMRMTDSDALPGRSVTPLRRTYDSTRSKIGAFGRGWTSIFDASLKTSERTALIDKETGDLVIFTGPQNAYVQTYPAGQSAAASLVYSAATSLYTYRDGRLERKFRAGDGRLVAIRDLSSPYEITITYDASGLPLRVIDANGSWSWTVAPGPQGIASISVDGASDLTWTYEYAPDGNLEGINSPAGYWRLYTYGPSGLVEARDAAGQLLEAHIYDAAGRAITSASADDNVQSITYDLPGRVPGETKTRVVNAAGEPTDYYSRAVAGKMRTVQIVGGCSCGTDDAVYAHDQNGHVVREQNARGYITQRTFSGDLLVAESTAMRPANCNPATDSARCRLDPDALASVSLASTQASVTRTFAYADANWPDRPTLIQTSSVLQPGGTTEQRFIYEAVTGVVLASGKTGWTGQPTRQETRTTTTALYNGTETAAFNPGGAFQTAWASLPQPRGERKSIDGPRTDVSDVTIFVYYPLDASVPQRLRGRLAAVRNAAGHVTRYESYDVFGNVTRAVDANGVATETTYDGLGRQLRTTIKGAVGCDQSADPLCATDLTSTFTYSGAGRLASQTRSGGGVVTYEYDSRGRTTAISRGPALGDLRERMETEYQEATGYKLKERWLAREGGTWIEKRAETYHHDGFGNLIEVLHPDLTSVGYSYGQQRQLVSKRDENHTLPNTSYTYDPAGRLSVVVQELAGAGVGSIATRYSYDIHGNRTSVTDPNGNVTTYRYDDFGQMVRQVSPVTGVMTYNYDAVGQLVSSTDANGAVTTRIYDILGRVVSATSTRGSQSELVSWTWDSGPFGIGRLTSMSDTTGSAVYGYERRGMVSSEEKTIQGAVYTTRFRYDADGNRSRIAYPSGAEVAYTFDYAGRPYSAARGTTMLASSAKYLPFGPMTELVYGNGTRMSAGYDARYRNTTRALHVPAGTLASYSYAHDSTDNITRITDALDSRFTRDFAYDDLNRLTVANSGSALWGAGSYSYDAMGNMLSLSLGGTRSASFAYEASTPKLTAVTENGITRAVNYDAAGNEIVVGSESFTYSPRNHLLSAENVSYVYDGRGIRTITSRVVPPPTIASFTISPTTLVGGNNATATLTLSSAAPQGGVQVGLSSSNASVSVPAFVLIPERSTSANALITTTAVSADLSSTITASYDASTATASLAVKAPRLVSLEISPTQVTGSTAASGTITLDGVAPEGGAMVTLDSNAAAASVPGTVAIPAGAATAAFTINTSAVSSQTTVTITATLSGTARTATLLIVPPGLAQLRFAPQSLHGGQTTTGTAALSGPAPAGGATIALSSSTTELSVPSTVTIPGGSTSADFSATASPVETATSVVVSTTYLGTTQSGTVTIVPPDLVSFEVTPAMPTGGGNATARATLDAPAAPAGASVVVTSSDTNLVPPATLTIPGGSIEGTAALPTNPVPAATPVVVSATRNGITRSSVVTLQPPGVTLASLTIAPASLVGSNPATGTITLTDPAPSSGLEVELTSSDPARASVPPTVVVAPGATQATFSIATTTVTTTAQVTVTASHGVTTKSATLTLLPPGGNHLASVSIVPQYIVGGQTASGTVSLAMPSNVNGGSDVTLASSDASVVVPSRVTVKKNQSSETFMVSTSAVGTPRIVVITASYGGVIQQTSVIVAPQNTITIVSFTIAPLRVIGGNASAGTVTLNAPAPFGGAVITIAARRRNMVTVPQSITITEGVTSATFAIGTDPIHGNRDRSVAIDATYNGITRTATLTIAPPSSAAQTAAMPAALCASAAIAPCATVNAVTAAATIIPPQQEYSLYSPQLHLLAETQSTASSTPAIAYEYVWFGRVPLAQIDTSSGAAHFYFNDHLGTPILTTTLGVIDWRVEREPYGKILLTRNDTARYQPLAFLGQEDDKAIDRSYNIFRWYRAAWGRYTQADPIGLRGDRNLFAYAKQNAARYTDRTGLIVNMGQGEFRDRIGDAIYALRLMIINCNRCVQYFWQTGHQPGGNQRYANLLSLIYGSATPPYVYPANFITDVIPNLPPGNEGEGLRAWTPPYQDNMIRVPEDVIQNFSSCALASLILHEMIHIVNNDPMNNVDTERLPAFQACTQGCIDPTYQ